MADRVLRDTVGLGPLEELLRDPEVKEVLVNGHDEVWVHSDQFSAIVSPRRGGAVEEYTLFSRGIN